MPASRSDIVRKTVVNKRGQKVIVTKKPNGTIVRQNKVTGVVTMKKADGTIIKSKPSPQKTLKVGAQKKTITSGVYNPPPGAKKSPLPGRYNTTGINRKPEPTSRRIGRPVPPKNNR